MIRSGARKGSRISRAMAYSPGVPSLPTSPVSRTRAGCGDSAVERLDRRLEAGGGVDRPQSSHAHRGYADR